MKKTYQSKTAVIFKNDLQNKAVAVAVYKNYTLIANAGFSVNYVLGA